MNVAASDDVACTGKALIVTGGVPHVRGFTGSTFAEIDSFFAFDPAFSGGVFVG